MIVYSRSQDPWMCELLENELADGKIAPERFHRDSNGDVWIDGPIPRAEIEQAWTTSDDEAERILERAIKRAADICLNSEAARADAVAARAQLGWQGPLRMYGARPSFESLNELVYAHLPPEIL